MGSNPATPTILINQYFENVRDQGLASFIGTWVYIGSELRRLGPEDEASLRGALAAEADAERLVAAAKSYAAESAGCPKHHARYMRLPIALARIAACR